MTTETTETTETPETTETTETTPDTSMLVDGSVAAVTETSTATEAGSSSGGRAPAGTARSADLWATGPRSRRIGVRGTVVPEPGEPDPR